MIIQLHTPEGIIQVDLDDEKMVEKYNLYELLGEEDV